jgi:hypothetical protein
MGWLVALIIILAFAGFCIFKSAEAYELHKIKDFFEEKKFNINVLIHDYENNLEDDDTSDEDFNVNSSKQELQIIDEIEKKLDKDIDELQLYDLKKFKN